MSVASFRVARMALRDIQTCFVTCRKPFCVAGAIRFSENVWQLSWQAQQFGRVHRHVAWHAQNFRRVVLRPFCEISARAMEFAACRHLTQNCHGCVKWRQGP